MKMELAELHEDRGGVKRTRGRGWGEEEGRGLWNLWFKEL